MRLRRKDERPQNLIEVHEGCWRVFRLSSSTKSGEEPKLTRSFLNIKPLRIMEQQL